MRNKIRSWWYRTEKVHCLFITMQAIRKLYQKLPWIYLMTIMLLARFRASWNFHLNIFLFTNITKIKSPKLIASAIETSIENKTSGGAKLDPGYVTSKNQSGTKPNITLSLTRSFLFTNFNFPKNGTMGLWRV